MKTSQKVDKTAMKPWVFCGILLYITFSGGILLEWIFLDLDTVFYTNMAFLPLIAGLPIALGYIISYYKFPNFKASPVILVVIFQVAFIAGGVLMGQMDFYFIMTILGLGIVMILKRLVTLVVTTAITIFIHISTMIFIVPNIEWINYQRFLLHLLLYLFAASLFLIMTYSAVQKENSSERAYSSFSSLLGSTPNYMVITDSLNRVQYISKPMAQFAYFSSQELAVGRPLLDLFSDKKLKLMFSDILDANGFIQTFVTIEMNGEERHFTVIADKLNGNTVYGNVEGNGDKTGKDGASGMFIDISDITPMIISKKAAEEAQAQAEAASLSKSRFLAAMSHEIRTPMNAIIGIAQIQLQKENLSAEYSEALEKIYNSGTGLLGIINDILDLSKIETGKMEINPVEYNVPSLINDTAQLNIVKIDSKPLEFILDIEENLPSKLIGDEIRLKQILNNLLSNAIKYTSTGHVKLSVRHSEYEKTILLRISVEDTGQGLKPEDCQKLFTEYSRFNMERNRETEGTGIGLNITKSLVELMGGTISVKSEYGKGSIFTVRVKQEKVECEEIGLELSERLKNFTYNGDRHHIGSLFKTDNMSFGKVLIVDDLETNLYVAKGLMSPYELNIETALSGQEAIEKVESGKNYNIIFMDHMMPLMDGIETTQKLRAMSYDGIIVALTANALTGNAEMFIQNGFDDFIAKPIDVKQLNIILNKYIPANNEDRDSDISQPKDRDPKAMDVFLPEAEKALVLLEQAAEDFSNSSGQSLRQLTIAINSIKNSLADIGEYRLKGAAAALENAGDNEERDFIKSYIGGFIDSLKQLINKGS